MGGDASQHPTSCKYRSLRNYGFVPCRRRSPAEIRAQQTTFDQRLALEREFSLVEAQTRYLVNEVGQGRMTEVPKGACSLTFKWQFTCLLALR